MARIRTTSIQIKIMRHNLLFHPGYLQLPMPYLLLLFLLLIRCPLSGQDYEYKRQVIGALGINEMTPEGQDTMVYYYQTDFFNLFGLTGRLLDPKTVQEAAEINRQFFLSKLSASDLKILDDYWQRQVDEYRMKTLERGERYRVGLICQQQIADSVLMGLQPQLMPPAKAFLRKLTEDQLIILRTCYDKSIEKLRRKGEEFITFEKKFTLDITPHIHAYMVAAFRLMEKIPTSYYYNLVGASNDELRFLSEMADPYFDLYADFEKAILDALNEEGCRAHLAIPFYHFDLNKESIHSKRNAAFFAVLNSPIEGNLAVEKTAINQDTLVYEVVQSREQRNVREFINADALIAIGFFERPIPMPDTYSFVKENSEGDKSALAFTLIKEEAEQKEVIKMINNAIRSHQAKLLHLEQIHVFVESSENKNLDEEIYGVFVHNGNLFQLMFAGKEASMEKLKEILPLAIEN